MIYFIQDEGIGHIKIGYTGGEAGDRVRALQVGSAAGLVVLFTMPGTMAEEKALHERFRAARKAVGRSTSSTTAWVCLP